MIQKGYDLLVSQTNEEEFVRSRVNLFLKLKKIIENHIGEIDEPK